MNDEAQQFLQELAKELVNDSKKDEIIAEYTMHVQDLLADTSIENISVYDFLVDRLGSPEELAALWKEERSVTPRRMQRLFVLLNIALFLSGAIFTIGYNVLEWNWLEALWKTLTEATTIVILFYMLFWGLLGYEIGKAFGARGRKILNRTFVICVIPNLLLMYLIVFRLIPYEWFDPLLNGSFILICIFSTAALYPISWLGYRWGRKTSV